METNPTAMNESAGQNFLASRQAFWIVSLLTIVLFLVTNLPWQLDDYDQAKQAWTSYEMITEGHWLYQRTSDDQGLATKPPLTGWVSAAIFIVTRSWDVAWRLPLLFCALLLAFVLFRDTTRAYRNIAGLIALAAFGLNLLSPRLSTLVRSEMALALVIFLIGLLIWKKIRTGEPWSRRDRLSMFALLTAGMLIKGPIVYAFLLPGLAFFQWRSRKTNGPSAWCGWWPWLASLAIFLLWVAGGLIWVPRFYDLVIVREFLARFGEVGEHVHRAHSFLFYLPHLLHKFLPWSVLMIAMAIFDLRSRQWSIRAAFREMSPETFWLICWSVGGLIVMSFVPSKRVDRIFPVIPPLCLLLGAQTAAILEKSEGRMRASRWLTATLVVACLLATGYSVSRIVAGYRDHRDALSIFGRQVRELATANHWRYEAVGSTDEGLPLYLTRPHFLKRDRAVEEWNAGNIDALAVPENEMPRFMSELKGVTPPTLRSVQRKNLRRSNYVLLTH
jgi:4-amino-4-deoxy-L-arabinose transferase-like glycosyltransferase